MEDERKNIHKAARQYKEKRDVSISQIASRLEGSQSSVDYTAMIATAAERELAPIRSQLSSLEQISGLQSEIYAVKQSVNEELSTLRSQMSTLEQLTGLRSELHDLKKTVDNIPKTLPHATFARQDDFEELEKSLKKERAAINEEFTSSLQSIEQRLEAVEVKSADAQAPPTAEAIQHQVRQSLNAAVDSKFQMLSDAHSHLRQHVRSLEPAHQGLRNDITGLQGQVTAVKVFQTSLDQKSESFNSKEVVGKMVQHLNEFYPPPSRLFEQRLQRLEQRLQHLQPLSRPTSNTPPIPGSSSMAPPPVPGPALGLASDGRRPAHQQQLPNAGEFPASNLPHGLHAGLLGHTYRPMPPPRPLSSAQSPTYLDAGRSFVFPASSSPTTTFPGNDGYLLTGAGAQQGFPGPQSGSGDRQTRRSSFDYGGFGGQNQPHGQM